MSWDGYSQQGDWELINALGSDLSAILRCPTRYCAAVYNKPVFECHCNKVFPKFAVEAAQQSGDWSQIVEHHRT